MTIKANYWSLGLGLLGLVLLSAFFLAHPALAQTAADLGLNDQFNPGLGTQDPRIIIANVIRVILGFLGIVAVGIIMYGGFVLMTGSDREGVVAKAQSIIVNGVVGLVIILSAFAITQFVLSTLLDATGANNSVNGSEFDSQGGPPGGVPFGSGFTLKSVTPAGPVPIRNVVVQIALSSHVNPSTVNDNVVVRPVGSTTPVPGTFVATGPVIRFTPEATCPTPNTSRHCFTADTAFEVVIASGLKSSNGSFVNCGFAGCVETFVTGSLVDVTPPTITITYPSSGDSVSTSPDVPMTMSVGDDAGIGLIEGFVDAESIGTDAPMSLAVDYTAIVNWSASGLVPQSSHAMYATVTDLAGQSTDASSVNVIARPDHCFDGVQNFGETGLDCGGEVALADYCGACSGDACTSDEDCSTGHCVNNICVELPQIIDVSPANGAPGNYITITGDALGSSAGTVTFLGDITTDADDLVAGLACSAWSSMEVIVMVPSTPGIYPVGPIKITTVSGSIDRTDDSNGPYLPDFEINTVVRPGLCSVAPVSAQLGDAFAVTGANLGTGGPGTEVYLSSALVSSVSGWTATNFNAIVPPTPVGDKNLTVRVGSEVSNSLHFEVESPDADSAPIISYLSPESGPPGEYLTIFGSNFGASGNVYFVDPITGNEAVGSVDFPDLCTVAAWTSNAITVKVPSEYLVPSGAPIAFGTHNLRVERTPTLVSENVGFGIVSGTPGPGICGITPVSGPSGVVMSIYGENFGSSMDSVTFYNGQAAVVSSWDDEEIQVTVPPAAVTGPVVVNVAGDDSNEANFEVGFCNPSNDTCSTGSRCCANTLSCTPVAVACEVTVPTTNYLFEWVTGPIPVVPRVVRQCDDVNVVSRVVSPSPWDGRSNGDQVCSNAQLSAAFTVPVINLNSTTILIQACTGTDPETPCASVSPTTVPGSFELLSDRFIFTPASPWSPATTYQVTLTTGILAAGPNGEPLAAPFVWTFTTRTSAAPCAIERVLITPGQSTLTEQGNGLVNVDGDAGDVQLIASGIGSDVCVLLNITEPMSWSTSNNVGVPVSPSVSLVPTVAATDTIRIARADNETVGGPVSAIATLIAQGINGLSLVTVNYTDPEIRNFWPNCDTACVNAQIGAEFNTAMNPSSLSAASVHLKQCQTELCQQFVATIPVTVHPLAANGREQVITPSTALAPNTYYRVIFDGTISSSSGVPLTGLNYGDGYSWTFRVSPTGALCTVDHVVTSPASVTLQAIGQRQAFSVTPFGPPDSCSDGGQRISASGFDWSWASSNVTTAFLLGDPTGALDLGAAPGCTSSCVLSGSAPNLPVCGDGYRNTQFEECDDGNLLPNDGCSSSCLWEGLPACGNPGDLYCCGNGTQDPHEECDDSNSMAGDGCSTVCLNEGSASVGAQCGNGSLAYLASIGGEDCDDGNTSGGDGCSSQCLYEGSSSLQPASCGNGILQSTGGEECDDGNALNGDGCSSQCLTEAVLCGPTLSVACCGDDVVNVANREQCDGTEGCTSSCRLAGSSYAYTSPSFCGDGVTGIGENILCEGLGGDGRVDGIQVAEVSVNITSQDVPVNGLFSTQISSQETVSTETDTSALNVQCTCEASNECPTGGVSYACGAASGCCAPRPAFPTFYPTGSDVCRNVEVRVIFDQFIDTNSLSEGQIVAAASATTTPDATIMPTIALRIPSLVSETACTALNGYSYVAKAPVDLPFVPVFVNTFFTRVLSLFQARSAEALAPGCYFPAALVPVTASDHTEVIVRYSAALEADQLYEIVVVGDANPTDSTETGVRTNAGAGLNTPSGEVIGSFKTGSLICDLDLLEVNDATGNGLFLQANSEHTYTVSALSRVNATNVPVTPIPGVYDWNIAWSVPDGSDILAVTGDIVSPSGEVVGAGVTSGQISGDEDVSAIATITADTLHDPSLVHRTVSDSLRSRVFLCEVPWPDNVTTPGVFEAPLSDTAGNDDNLGEGTFWSNFSTLYCRAETAPESALLGIPTAYAQAGILPNFEIIQPVLPPPGVDKEFILRHPTQPEAIGLRVMRNVGVDANNDGDFSDTNDVPGFLPIGQWYGEQGFNGSPTATVVDGYRAIQDGRTVYVGAANIRSGGDIDPTIFAISYSANASPETMDVYNQLVSNLQFLAGDADPYAVSNTQVCLNSVGDPVANPNGGFFTCTTDAQCIVSTSDLAASCDSSRDKIRRDIARIEDLRSVEGQIVAYGDTHKHCSVTTNLLCLNDSNCPGTESCNADIPLLDAGSFIRGWSVSAWPSWSSELGNTLGTALPVDPVNAFAVCPASDGYDSSSCWNGSTNLFQCPVDSHVYRYQRSGIENVLLSVDLETQTLGNGNLTWTAAPLPIATNTTLTFGNYQVTGGLPTPTTCNGSTYGAGGACGDGVIGELSPGVPEVCEIGQTNTESCTYDFNANGVIESTEVGVRATTCASSCAAYTNDSSGDGVPDSLCIQLYCGNGVVDTGELCDDGALNGFYGYCSTSCDYDAALTLMCGNGALEGPELCDDGALNGQYDVAGAVCAWDCSGSGPRCGDGLINGAEQCDSVIGSWLGALCSDTREPCTTDAECAPGATCGDGNAANDGDQFTYSTAYDACPLIGFCVGGAHPNAVCNPATGALVSSTGACTDGGGICTQFETARSRTCESDTSMITACQWDTWTSCLRQGSCGDGVQGPGEACDDGNTSNNDSCTNTCQANVCGDGFLNPSLESCDLGYSVNGTACVANYGGVCNYCTTTCSYQTVSGGFCGDDLVQPVGGEICDGNAPMYYFDIEATFETYRGGVCYISGAEDPAHPGATCQVLGVCNGGTHNGETCSVTSSVIGNAVWDSPGCFESGDGGSCVVSECESSCSNSCPFNFESIFALAQPWHSFTNAAIPNQGFGDSIELFSYETNGTCSENSDADFRGAACQVNVHCNPIGQSNGTCQFLNGPDYAKVQFPDCRVGAYLLADVDYEFTYPELDVVFVIDQSSSMSREALGDGTRWTVMIEALNNAVNTLYTEYPGTLRTGIVTFGGRNLSSVVPAAGYDYDQSTTDCVNESFWNPSSSVFDWPTNWQDIEALAPLPDSRATHLNTGACMQIAPTTSSSSVLAAINQIPTPPIPAGTGYSTPTAAGLARAKEILLQYPVTHERIVILLSDGVATCTGADNFSDACRLIVQNIYDQSSQIRNQGMDVYSAYFNDDLTSSTALRYIRSFQTYSSDCPAFDGSGTVLNPGNLTASTLPPYNNADTNGLRWYGRYESCAEDPTFSYTGDQVDSMDEMFQTIIDNIIHARVLIGNDTAQVASTLIVEGPRVQVSLPEDFACPVPGNGQVDLKLQFPGEGTVTLNNFQFLYCSE
ncbi:TPA: hypothetical protein DEB00_01405 [Candidatus Uhrbacteria bacterium]|nr:hypothetical protein [Candidatus Uhrbacteria bacterium]